MRRSEIVKELKQTMGTYDSWEEQCKYMLEIIEKAGMLPPETIEKSVMPGLPDFKVNKWDPE